MTWSLIPGKYEIGNENSSIAIATLNSEFSFGKDVAIWGKIMTENLGVTRVLSNLLSNPNIRYLIVCGKEVQGHFPGDALISFAEKGYEINSGSIVIKNTIAADPRLPIENNSMEETYSRFKEQINLINLIGETDSKIISEKINSCLENRLEPMSLPYIINLKKSGEAITLEEDVAIHPKIKIKDNVIYKR
jgi:tetrahydromethanopterin S-methyltransferase subunit A